MLLFLDLPFFGAIFASTKAIFFVRTIEMDEDLKLDLCHIKLDAYKATKSTVQRGLLQASKWSAEILFALKNVKIDFGNINEECEVGVNDMEGYTLAKNYFDLKEYDRAAHFLQDAQDNVTYFLYIYSRYLSGEKKRLDDLTEALGPQEAQDLEFLQTLRSELRVKHVNGQLDGYCLYLYGVVLRKLDLLEDAGKVLREAVHAEPLHWGAWQELSALVNDKEELLSMDLPNVWMKYFFLADTYLEMHHNEEALRIMEQLADAGLDKSTYLIAQTAVAQHNLRDADVACQSFSKLLAVDPYRLENMDAYSNLLYVKEMRTELAQLAHHCCDVDKYRVETCCVIGNYYSLRQQHDKAVLYFTRALKLNPEYLSALTLIGHEYMELKNTAAAIQAYRQAVEVNRKDHRAWYGLGQTYEILKMPSYSLYYYRQAQVLQPNDSRMLVALGETYDKLDRLQEAKKCFWKAHSVGDLEGVALVKLARLFERLQEMDQAAAAYTEFINESELQGISGRDTEENKQCAFRFLATYYLNHNRLDEAYSAAQKCTEFNQTREEGKAILREISKRRALERDGTSQDTADTADTPFGVRNSITTETDTPPLGRLDPMNLTYTP